MRAMHVAIVCPYSMSRPGGVQEHTRGLATALLRAGHEVSVFGPELRGEQGLDGVQTVSLGRAVGVPANGSIAPLGIDPRMLVRLDLGLDAPDVVHLHEPFLPASLGALWRAPRSTPVVGTFHASADRFLPYAVARPALRRFARRLATTTAVSPAARDLVRRYVPVDPVLVPNGVDADAFADAEPDPWAAGLGRVVLFVGRAERRKGFETALRAFIGAAATRADVHLVCPTARPGEGEELAGEFAARVHALGGVARSRLLALYKAADVVVVPSRRGESFGLVVLEGLAAGAAVVASDIPGYRYAGGDAVRYLPAEDLPAWRRGLEDLLDDEEARLELARRGPDRARDLDWARIADEMLKVYGIGST